MYNVLSRKLVNASARFHFDRAAKTRVTARTVDPATS